MESPSSTDITGRASNDQTKTAESSVERQSPKRNPYQPFLSPDHGSGFSLQTYIEPLLRRKWLMLGSLILPVACAVVYLRMATPTYTSVATIEMEEKTAGHSERLYGNPGYGVYRAYFLTQMEILKSRRLGDAVVQKMSDPEKMELAQGQAGLINTIRGLPAHLFSFLSPHKPSQDPRNPSASQLDGLVSVLLSRVDARPVKSTNLVWLGMGGSSPGAARDLLQTYVSVYLDSALENKRRESIEATVWLKGELEKAQKKAVESQAALVAFVVDNSIVAGPEGGLGLVNDMINKTVDSRLKAQEGWLRIRALKSRETFGDAYTLPVDMNSPYIGRLKEALAQLESEHTQQLSVYSENYPTMRARSQKIQFLRERITKIERGVVDAAIEATKKEEDLFKESFNQVKGEADRIKGLQAQYALYRKEVETDQEFLNILLKEYKAQEIKSRTIVSDIRLADPPSMPTGPSSPQPKIVMLAATIFGLILAVGTTFIAEKLDQSIYYPSEIDTDFHIQRLGVIPDATRLPESFQTPDSAKESLELMARLNPQSPMAHALRNLQVSVMLTSAEIEAKCILVSSATPQQGKTFVSASLTGVLSSNRAKAVVVDGDLRRPRLHDVFGLSQPAIGLSDFLASDAIHLRDILRYSTIPGVSYVTSGSRTADPVELFQSERLAELVEQLRGQFDYIVFDCPPVLGFADVFMLALHADGLIMVVKQGAMTREEFRESVRAFSSTQTCPLLGVVMNGMRFPSLFGYRFGDHYLAFHNHYYAKG